MEVIVDTTKGVYKEHIMLYWTIKLAMLSMSN